MKYIEAPSKSEGASVISSAFVLYANSRHVEKRAQMETGRGATICSYARGLNLGGQDNQETVQGELTNCQVNLLFFLSPLHSLFAFGRSGLFGPPLCGGSAPATPPPKTCLIDLVSIFVTGAQSKELRQTTSRQSHPVPAGAGTRPALSRSQSRNIISTTTGMDSPPDCSHSIFGTHPEFVFPAFLIYTAPCHSYALPKSRLNGRTYAFLGLRRVQSIQRQVVHAAGPPSLSGPDN